MAEKDIQTRLHLAVGAIPGVTLFRNNVGMGWVGELVRKYANGSIELKEARPLHSGLCVGSSDLIGWRTVEITPDMVGQKVAVFLAMEVKTSTGATREKQRLFIAAVNAAGGIAGVARSPEEARALVG